MEICPICEKELQGSALIEWEAMPGVAWHLDCDWTSDGRAWFEAQRQANPMLNRQVELRTMGLEQRCQECGYEQSVNPTAIGMDPTPWDVNCTACGEYWPDAINASRNQDIVSALWRFCDGNKDVSVEVLTLKEANHERIPRSVASSAGAEGVGHAA